MSGTMTPNLDIDQLKTFLAIADTGSFTRAAEETNKTQSAVSMQMKKLEEILGRNLFLRDGRGSRMSPDGELFVGHARNLVAMNDEIALSYMQPSITGTVRFGTPDDYAELILPEVLAKFARSHPMVTVDVECVGSAHLFERIKRGEMDVALVTFYENENDGEILRQEELRWVTSSRHAVHNLPNLPVAAADAGCQWRKLAIDCLNAQGRSFRIAYSSSNRSTLDATVLQGLAVAVMPAVSMRPGMRMLTEAEGFPALGKFNIGLLRKSGKQSQAAEALAAHVRDSFGAHAQQKVAAA
jgi:DNA-binding transcriptional LysR family regulator